MSPSSSDKSKLPSSSEALPGREKPLIITEEHHVLGTSLHPPYPKEAQLAMFGMGCFWGAERKFWELSGVHTTAVGYAAGFTPNATYEEVCSGRTGHNEVVRVVYLPDQLSYAELLRVFWESHDPTQGMGQGNDLGTQYRSGIYFYDEAQLADAETSRRTFAPLLAAAGFGEITTEIEPAAEFYFAEAYHQQYLSKNPNGYCGLGGTGLRCGS